MATKQFADLGLDPRLMRALSKKAYTAPTPVQAEAIPKSLEGRDIVARARTGSGKTMAYLLPALHKLLGSANTSASFQVIVLVPTRELCEQVRQEAHGMAVHCGAGLSVTSLGNETTDHAARIAVSNAGQLVVTTPGRLATALKDKTLPAAHLHEHLQVRRPSPAGATPSMFLAAPVGMHVLPSGASIQSGPGVQGWHGTACQALLCTAVRSPCGRESEQHY